MRTATLLWPAGLVLLAFQACTNDFRQFEFDLEPGGQAPGGSGAGGGPGGAGATGGAPECSFPYECPGEDTQCRGRTCQNGRCGISSFQAGLHCSEEGGEVCDGMGNCVLGTCVDGVHSGSETAVDCGGPDCDPCDDGAACLVPRDCTSRFCERGEGGAGSGGQGPGVCDACSDEGQCAEAGDAYCDGGLCLDRKPDGAGCNEGLECQSGSCPVDDGVCCDEACDGACVACLEAKSGEADGTCAPVSADQDPDAECADGGQDACGANGTGCNGDDAAPGCHLYAATSTCNPQLCDGDPPEQHTSGQCDGAGTCAPGAGAPCAPYQCNATGTACLQDCATGGNADCYGAYYCDSSDHCVPQ